MRAHAWPAGCWEFAVCSLHKLAAVMATEAVRRSSRLSQPGGLPARPRGTADRRRQGEPGQGRQVLRRRVADDQAWGARGLRQVPARAAPEEGLATCRLLWFMRRRARRLTGAPPGGGRPLRSHPQRVRTRQCADAGAGTGVQHHHGEYGTSILHMLASPS